MPLAAFPSTPSSFGNPTGTVPVTWAIINRLRDPPSFHCKSCTCSRLQETQRTWSLPQVRCTGRGERHAESKPAPSQHDPDRSPSPLHVWGPLFIAVKAQTQTAAPSSLGPSSQPLLCISESFCGPMCPFCLPDLGIHVSPVTAQLRVAEDGTRGSVCDAHVTAMVCLAWDTWRDQKFGCQTPVWSRLHHSTISALSGWGNQILQNSLLFAQTNEKADATVGSGVTPDLNGVSCGVMTLLGLRSWHRPSPGRTAQP